ncbi:glycosyltransferase [Paenibacillus sp. N3.4]|uniref:glycosyltransferase n=1 Tax=Paenibacillus sp. N3.4 TaxID=2603222 RepID=UPI0021C28746|nr:glycosyltransferase [Paenibacillus sp. N3.4]
MNRGGAQSFIMNVYRQMDRSKIQFDFIVHTYNPCDYDEEIRSLGGRIFNLRKPYRVGWWGFLYELRSTIQQQGPFHAIHSHTHDAGGFALLIARMLGIDIRIAHSHSLSDFAYSSPRNKMTRWLKTKMIRRLATNWVGSSKSASQVLFGRRWSKDKRSKMVHNGIDVIRFTNRLKEKAALREELLIPSDAPLVGHIGRFSGIKNHRFLVEIFEELLFRIPNARLILIGDGVLRTEIQRLVEHKGIQNHVHLLGHRDDVPELLQELDVLVIPSFKGGVPMVLIEAQAAGIPCIVSDHIPAEANLKSGFFSFVSLNQDTAVWVQWLLKALVSEPMSKDQRILAIQEAGYDIRMAALELEELYAAKIG